MLLFIGLWAIYHIYLSFNKKNQMLYLLLLLLIMSKTEVLAVAL